MVVGLTHASSAVAEWVRALAWTGDRTVPAGFESHFGKLCSQYLGHDRGSQGPCICPHCYFVYSRRKFDNSKRLTCEFVLSGDVVYFQQRGVRHIHNVNEIVKTRDV